MDSNKKDNELSYSDKKREHQVNTLLNSISENSVEEWSSSCLKRVPFTLENGKTVKKYFGINALTLSILKDQRGLGSDGWLTANKCKSLGLKFKGIKPESIVYSAPTSVKIYDEKKSHVIGLINKNVTYPKKKKDAVISKLKDSGYVDIYILTYIYKKINHLAPKDKVSIKDVIGDLGRAAGRGLLKFSQVFNISDIELSTIENSYLDNKIMEVLVDAESNDDRIDIINDYILTDIDAKEKSNALSYLKSMDALNTVSDASNSIEMGATEDSDELFTREEVSGIVNGIIDTLSVDVRTTGSPYFSPSGDYIGMPDISDSKTPTGYLFTFLHELSHWTGHESRFSDFGRQEPISLGTGRDISSNYALEELAVTISASNIISEHTGYYVLAGMDEHNEDNKIDIPNDPMAYLSSWTSNDPIKRISEISSSVDRGGYISRALNPILSPVFEEVLKSRNDIDNDTSLTIDF